MSDNAYINDLENRLAEAEKQLAEAKAHIERTSKPWRFELITLPVPRKQEPGNYPDLSESYELSLVDTGHSERVYLLGSNELDKRINDLQTQLTAALATVEKCKAAGFIDERGEVRKVLGTLPVTEDGCVIGHRATVWGFFDDGEPGWCDFVDVTVGGDDWDQTPGGLYSTNEAAAAANGGGQ